MEGPQKAVPMMQQVTRVPQSQQSNSNLDIPKAILSIKAII